jgi:hypothetical protein
MSGQIKKEDIVSTEVESALNELYGAMASIYKSHIVLKKNGWDIGIPDILNQAALHIGRDLKDNIPVPAKRFVQDVLHLSRTS